MSNRWRQLAAALADPGRREAYARAVLGLPVENAKAVRALRSSGLLDETDAPTDVFARLLAEHPAESRQGVDRWVRNGRIDHYPARPTDRLALLEWVAARLPAGSFTEKQLGALLEPFGTDVAVLRRYLVDADLLARAADGSSYEVVRALPGG